MINSRLLCGFLFVAAATLVWDVLALFIVANITPDLLSGFLVAAQGPAVEKASSLLKIILGPLLFLFATIFVMPLSFGSLGAQFLATSDPDRHSIEQRRLSGLLIAAALGMTLVGFWYAPKIHNLYSTEGFGYFLKDGILLSLPLILSLPMIGLFLGWASWSSRLLYAAESGKIENVERLLKQGWNPSMIIQHKTPLEAATENGHVDVMRLLLDHEARIRPEAFLALSDSDNIDGLKLFLNYGVKINDYVRLIPKMEELSRIDKFFIIHSRDLLLNDAVSCGAIRLTEHYLQQGFDSNKTGLDGCTALHWAAFKGNKEMIELLLSYGADITVKDNNGFTARDLAMRNNHESVSSLLE